MNTLGSPLGLGRSTQQASSASGANSAPLHRSGASLSATVHIIAMHILNPGTQGLPAAPQRMRLDVSNTGRLERLPSLTIVDTQPTRQMKYRNN